MRLLRLIIIAAAVPTLLSGCKMPTNNQMAMGLPGVGLTHSLPTLTSARGGNFYANGFPTDLRRDELGNIDITDFPRQIHWLTERYINNIPHMTNGYHTVMPVYLPFAAAIDMKAMSRHDTDYTDPDSPVQLIDVDADSPQYGRRFPLQLSQTRMPDSYRPQHLLQAIPTFGVGLRPNTTYALIVSNATPLRGLNAWEQHPQLAAVLMPSSQDIAIAESVSAVYQPLRDFLAQQAIDPHTIVGATVWTTGDPLSRFHRGAEQVAMQAAQLDTLPVSTLESFDDYPEYCVIRGFVDLPGYQKGIPPYWLLGGDVEWHGSGEPKQQYTRRAEFVLTIPKYTPMPETGFPLLSYVHGASGDARQVYDRGEFDHIDLTRHPYYIGKAGEGPAQIAAERGWANSGLAGHIAYDHIGQTRSLFGTAVYNLFNPVGLSGVYMTMAWERIFFRRIAERIEVDRALCPAADPGPGQTHFRFDPDLQVNMGQSQGNWVNALMVAADPRPYQGVIFSGAAGTWTRLFNNNPGFELSMNTAVINRIPFLNLDDAHPFLMLMEWILGPVDAAVNIETLMRYPSKTPPHVIGFSGFNDYLLAEGTQRPFFMALGSDLAGDDIGVSAARTLMPHIQIAGAQQTPYPASNNFMVPGHGLRTNLVMRYRGNNPVLLYNGHEVLFQSDAIKHQYGCFLQHLAAGIAPIVAEGFTQGDPCL